MDRYVSALLIMDGWPSGYGDSFKYVITITVIERCKGSNPLPSNILFAFWIWVFGIYSRRY